MIRKILIKAYNNSDWYSDVSYAILTLTENKIKEIRKIQEKLSKHFPTEYAEVKMYGQNYEWYSEEEDIDEEIPQEIKSWLKECETHSIQQDIIISDEEQEKLPNDNDEQKKDCYIIVVDKDSILLKSYLKYGENVEIFSDPIIL